MEEYVEVAGFDWIDPNKVDKDNDSLWRMITVPEEIEFFLLKRNNFTLGNQNMNLYHSQWRQ